MKYEKPDIKAQKFTTQDFLSNSSVDDNLPGESEPRDSYKKIKGGSLQKQGIASAI